MDRKRELTGYSERESVANVINSLRLIVKSLRTSGREAEQKLGISSAQLYILQELQDRPAQSINQLAERTFTHQSSVSNVVAKLVEGKFVTRNASAADARRVSVSLSPAGRALVKRSPKAQQRRVVDALRSMPNGELNDLARGLATLTKLLDESTQVETNAKAADMRA